MKKALGEHELGVRKKLDAVMHAVNRDEVDARKQLEAGQEDLAAPEDESFGAGVE